MQECTRPQWASVCPNPTVTWNTPITQADWYSNSSHSYCPLYCLNPRRFNNSMYVTRHSSNERCLRARLFADPSFGICVRSFNFHEQITTPVRV
jgi:hypothetical protein